MELLQVLEPGDSPQKATWYALVPKGESPGVRVGHNCIYVPNVKGEGRGKVLIVGGANPNGSFSDAFVIDLDTHEWDIPEWKGLLPRYEHASFIPASDLNSLWVFGGADQSGNRNCVQVLDLETGTWRSPKVRGTPPSARTFHTSTAAIGDKLYVFGGGDKGADPVQDTQLHVFDTATLTWSQPEADRNPPAPRHGHVLVAVETKLFIHGGLSGVKFYNDMYCIDTVDMKWEKLKVKGDIPSGCAAHSAVAHGKYIYIFGGMDMTGALNTMYKYHIEKQCWTLIRSESPLPSKRLDHSMCIIPWKVHAKLNTQTRKQNSKETLKEKSSHQQAGDLQEEISNTAEDEYVNLCLLFGGMDTKGEIYNDCLLTTID
ncbi:rab9 effector protein with kelch motifs isoform X2 [Latimeria chalumnae]|nr:PREDICTED: rab9 effector protein with kelch motifs isoform X2 [Latimeria chalumnae]XP_005987379.1 PREDICTED: rab9 effector protein with kelch motifs isoform X2 [Latimeria chalumnae]XP_005987381.1 PREDICTED: rab9 effector protein with kelch motifs isoform X2 [Latimeria chalumnae]|eukprot:XP_005987378.1 PREDICTED: rab9 effector protein with kelch motifs isoform X2 [Latimeria chalumnae]